MSVSQVYADVESVSFNRWLTGSLLADWSKIVNDMNKFKFNSDSDVVFWKFGPSGRFSVKSAYSAMTKNESGPYHKKNLEK